MKIALKGLVAIGVCGIVGGLHAPTANALSLSYELTGSTATRTGSGTVTDYSGLLPAHDGFTHNVASSPLIDGTAFTFYDDYLIKVPDNTFNLLTESISLGDSSISNLQVRIYAEPADSSLLPLTGTVPGAIEGWSQTINFTGGSISQSVIFPNPPAMLSQGTYVMEVRGVAGANGGTYSGNLNLNPVPLPAALPLLLSGLGLAGGFLRRRSRT